METLLPTTDVLAAGLATLIGHLVPVTVLDRRHHPNASRSRTEIITFQANGSEPRQVFIKYEVTWRPESCLKYEAQFHRAVLEPLKVCPYHFYGSYKEPETERRWLVMQYLDVKLTLDDMSDTKSMVAAAAWLGRFHRRSDEYLRHNELTFLKVFDAEYYLGFARRALEVPENRRVEFSWLEDLYPKFTTFVRPILARRPTISHGDYYLHNILYRDGQIFPIDWEFAGLEAGELDLVCLTDGWPEKVSDECSLAYQRERWPMGAPDDFENAMLAARLCILFHNIGRHADWTSHWEAIWYAARLRQLSQSMGLI